MGKTRIIAETGAGQHGVASATVAARFGFPCVVYMGATDVERQTPNVFRMKLLGAEVKPVTSGARHAQGRHERGAARLGHQCRDTYYLIGTAAGPHPYPEMVRDFQSVIGREATRADDGSRKAGCPTCWSPPSAAAPTPSACSIPSSTTGKWRSSASRPAGTASRVIEHCASLTAGAAGRAARQPHLSAAERRRPDHGRPFDLGRPRLSRHRPGTFLAAGYRPRRIRADHRHGGAGGLPAADAGSKASSRRWSPRMRSPQ